MGMNTQERLEFIIENLRVEKDLIEARGAAALRILNFTFEWDEERIALPRFRCALQYFGEEMEEPRRLLP